MKYYRQLVTSDNKNFKTSNDRFFKVLDKSNKIEFILFKYKKERYRVDKSQFLTDSITFKGVFRDEVDILNPIITIETDENLTMYNYAQIEIFGRYYFIENVSVVNNNLWTLTLSVDVLYTYKDTIFNTEGFIERCDTIYTTDLIDDEIIVTSGYDVVKYNVHNNLIEYKENEYMDVCFVITGYRLERDRKVIS